MAPLMYISTSLCIPCVGIYDECLDSIPHKMVGSEFLYGIFGHLETLQLTKISAKILTGQRVSKI